MDPVDPIVLTKNVQATCYGLIETARRNLGGMFYTTRVETGYPASSKRHAGDFSISLFIRQKLDAFTRKGVMKRLAQWPGRTSDSTRFNAGDEVDPQERSLVFGRCGHGRVRDARFCTKCGTSFDSSPDGTSARHAVRTSSRSNPSRAGALHVDKAAVRNPIRTKVQRKFGKPALPSRSRNDSLANLDQRID